MVTLLPATLIAFVASTAGAADPGEILFRSEAGGFEVRFPSAPTEQEEEYGGKAGRRVEAGSPGVGWLQVAWYDHFPEAERAREVVFRSELDGIVRGGARDLEDVPEPLDGLPGRAFRARVDDRDALRGRVAMRGTRVFLLLAIAPRDRVEAVAAAFFASFRLHGDGVSRPPRMPAARRVRFPEAAVSLELHGDLERREGGGSAEGLAPMLSARSRGGLRIESAWLFADASLSARELAALLDRIASTFLEREPGATRLRTGRTRGLPARDVRSVSGSEEHYVRFVLTRRGILTLRLQAVAGAVAYAEAAAFFDSLRIEEDGG